MKDQKSIYDEPLFLWLIAALILVIGNALLQFGKLHNDAALQSIGLVIIIPVILITIGGGLRHLYEKAGMGYFMLFLACVLSYKAAIASGIWAIFLLCVGVIFTVIAHEKLKSN